VNFLFWIVGTTVIRSCIGASDGLGPACRKKPQAHSGDLPADVDAFGCGALGRLAEGFCLQSQVPLWKFGDA
jgi:hypothetical protein